MALMARYPDKHFDLAIVDPPYGIGEDGKKNHSRGLLAEPTKFEPKKWDRAIPPPAYFAELRRVSREQIVWGGNWLADMLPPSSGFVVWHKHQNGHFSECEVAWVSHGKARHFDRPYQADIGNKIHPTQKPVALYDWLLANYAKPGQRVLDTHLGSGSHAIAAHYFGAHLTACEIDPDYSAAAMARIKRETAQTTLFT